MEIEKEFLPKQKNLLVVSSGEYYDEIIDNLKQLNGKSICYVTLNKTYKALREDFEKKGVDVKEMIIVDAISKTVKADQKAEKNNYFISSPGALTELSITIKKFLDYGFDYIVFDSLNSLLVYRDTPIVKRWVASIMGKIKESNTRAIFYMQDIGGQQDLIKKASSVADKVIGIDDAKTKDAGGTIAFSGELKNKSGK